MDLAGIRRRFHDLGGRPARGPIAQVPVDLGKPGPVVGLLRRGVPEMQARELGLNHLKPSGVTRLCGEIGRSGRSS